MADDQQQHQSSLNKNRATLLNVDFGTDSTFAIMEISQPCRNLLSNFDDDETFVTF